MGATLSTIVDFARGHRIPRSTASGYARVRRRGGIPGLRGLLMTGDYTYRTTPQGQVDLTWQACEAYSNVC